MDALALSAGNLMLGQDEGLAGIEIPVFPFQVRFQRDTRFALTGADCATTLDDTPLLPWSTCLARAGQTLTIGLPVQGSVRQSRAYLCVAGGIDVPLALGSRSTQLRGAFGGFEGRALVRGDVLPTGHDSATTLAVPGVAVVSPVVAMARHRDGVPLLRVLPAAEHERYTDASRERFWSQTWKITGQSDRYGFRLAGEPLVPLATMELRSHGIVPGVIQVPASGQPIVQMRDAQPTGGYPKFGTVIEADLWRLGQVPPGGLVCFECCTWGEACQALDDNETWLKDLQRQLGLLALNPLHKA
jgi:biotin-dependent carboxylase-like uncharacterized protein